MKQSIPDKAVLISWSLMWFMLPLSLKGTLLCLWLFGFATLYQIIRKGIHKIDRQQKLGAVLFVLFFGWQAISLIFDANHELWWKSLEKKSSLLIIPVLLIAIDQSKLELGKSAIQGFFAGLIVSGIIMISFAFFRSFDDLSLSTWTYHEFASPFSFGAIYLSWYYSAGLFYLTFKPLDPVFKRFKPFILLFFLLILLLLSSKLFIIITLPFIIWQLIVKNVNDRKKLITILSVLILVLAVSSPFILRVSELKNTDFKILKQNTFTYDTPFNGLTFRIIQWRFAYEILNQNDAWLTGVGMNSNQEILNSHYQENGIYSGNPDLGDKGYLDYNYHNQYLETLVSTGIPGLIILLLIILFIFFQRRSKLLFPLYVYLLTVLFFFSESVLERQAGIIFFCLIVFTFSKSQNIASGSHSVKT